MAKAPKVKNPEAVGFKEIFGSTALSTNNGIAAVFMSAMFMTFMTDYAGLGKMGATLATVLLLAARIIDAVDDPIQGFIMDSGKIGKHGKYKPFFLISIIMTTIGVIALYALPNGITTKAVAVSVWVIFFYLIYDIGASFYNQNLLFRTMTNDPGERSKLLIGPRLWVMILGMFGSAMAAIAVSIQAATGSYKTAYMILALVTMAISFIISIIGWFMVKEKHVVEQDPEDKVKFSDFFELMRTNKPMMLNFFKCIATGFIWTFLFAAPVYYVKYAYAADLSTGEVNMEYFATLSMIVSLMMLFPLLLGTIAANPVLKLFKRNFLKMHIFDLAMQGASGLLMFILQIVGLLRQSPIFFFVPMFLLAFFIGIDFVPGSNLSMEIMDYTIYKTGKDRSALTGVLEKFLEKAQSAVSSAIVGEEMERFGVHLWLAPALNIHRSIRCGRNFEYFSEDPLVSGVFAGAITKGVQQFAHTGTTIKHYAFNNQERNRTQNNSQVSERAAREIYLKGFGIAVRMAQPKAVMTSYNLANGRHTNARRDLIEDVLRAEFGYQGIVMTDWVTAGYENELDCAYPNSDAADVCMAGGDLFMPGSQHDYDRIREGLKNGSVLRGQLQVNATRVLHMAEQLCKK